MQEDTKLLIGATAFGAFVLVGGGWLAVSNGYLMQKTFAPKIEQVRRETFEQSQAYVEGQRRDVENLRMEWLGARTPEQKAAIKSIALQRIAGLPDAALSSTVIQFRNELRESN